MDQRGLVGRGSLVGAVGAGAVRGPLPDVEEAALLRVLLRFEQLVLGVGQLDAQSRTSVRGSDILLHPGAPGALQPAAARLRGVEHHHRHLVHRRHPSLGDLKSQLGATAHLGGGDALRVVPGGVDGEGGLPAERVGVVIVVPFPGVVAAVECEEAGEEEHGRPDLAVGADPAAAELHGQRGSGGQDRGVMLIGPGDDPARRARVHVVLQKAENQKITVLLTGKQKRKKNPKNQNQAFQNISKAATPPRPQQGAELRGAWQRLPAD